MSDERTEGGHIQDQELAAYLEGTLAPHGRSRVEAHLAECDACREEAVASFRTVRSRERVGRHRSLTWALSAAAAVVLLVGGYAIASNRLSAPPPFREGPADLTFEQIADIQVVSPADGGIVQGDSLVFAWRAESEETFYRLTLTDAAGDVLWRTTTNDTVATLEADVTLRPQVTYFWIVDALLAGGRTATTGASSFQIGAP